MAERIRPPDGFERQFSNPLWKVLGLDTLYGGFTSVVAGQRSQFSYMVVDLKHERTDFFATDPPNPTITTFFIIKLPQRAAGRRISRRPAGFAVHLDAQHVYLAKLGQQPRVAEWPDLLDKAIGIAISLQPPLARNPDEAATEGPANPRGQATAGAPPPTGNVRRRPFPGSRPVVKSPITGETVIEPLWGALAAAAASLCGTWPVVNMWLEAGKSFDGGGSGKLALMFLGPLTYLLVFGIVGKSLVWILSQMEESSHRAGIVGLTFALPLIGRGSPFFWELLLAATMAAVAAWQFNRVLEDEEDLERL